MTVIYKNRQTLIDLNKKLQLEKGFIPIVQRQFRDEIKLFRSSFIEFEDVPTLNADEWVAILQHQYDRSFNVFANLFGMSDLEKSFVFDNFDKFSDNRSGTDSAIIIDTTRREMVSSLNQAETALREEGLDVTRTSIAATASRILSRSMSPRVGSISTTETQAPSEEAKFSEASAKKKQQKTWNTILDGLERPAHLLADGQKVAINEPFNVKGELLKQPGDTSLGATIGNVIRCRCGAEYEAIV